jgi:hypothetical protein
VELDAGYLAIAAERLRLQMQAAAAQAALA